MRRGDNRLVHKLFWGAVSVRLLLLPLLLSFAVRISAQAAAPPQGACPVPLPTPVVVPPPSITGIPLTLDAAVQLALAHNGTLTQETGRVQESVAHTQEVGAPRNFQLKLHSEYSVLNKVPTIAVAPGTPPISLGNRETLVNVLTAQQVIFSGGRLSALVQQATDLAHAEEATAQRTRQQVIFQAERAYWQLLAAQRERLVAQQALATAQAQWHDAQVRFTAGTAAQFDVLRAQVDIDTAQQQLISADNAMTVAQAALLQALGLADGEYYAADGLATVASGTLPDLPTLLEQAYTRRPELRAVDWQLHAASDALRAARAERMPTISLLATYQQVSPESLELFNLLTLTAQADLNILDGGLVRAHTREAQAQRTQAQGARELLRTEVAGDVRQAYAQVTAASAQLAVAGAQVDYARELLRVARVRYQAGVATATEVSDAQSTLTQALQSQLQAQTNAAIDAAQLSFATGEIASTTGER
jgi:OMF family outer membrane factor